MNYLTIALIYVNNGLWASSKDHIVDGCLFLRKNFKPIRNLIFLLSIVVI